MAETMTTSDGPTHICISDGVIYDGDWSDCVNGKLYGARENDSCTGACNLIGSCQCECHIDAAAPSDLDQIRWCRKQCHPQHQQGSYELTDDRILVGCNRCAKRWNISREQAVQLGIWRKS